MTIVCEKCGADNISETGGKGRCQRCGQPLGEAATLTREVAPDVTAELIERTHDLYRKGSWSSLLLNFVITLICLGALGLGVLYFLAGDHRHALAYIAQRTGGETTGGNSLNGVHLTAMHSVLYTTADDKRVLVINGRAFNGAGDDYPHVDVVAELLNGEQKAVATATAPVGLPLLSRDIYPLTDAASLEAAYAKRAAAAPQLPLKKGQTAEFTVVITPAPADPKDLRHTLRFVEGREIKATPKEENVTQAQTPPPAEKATAEPLKAKKKAKKGKRRKGKVRKGKKRRGG